MSAIKKMPAPQITQPFLRDQPVISRTQARIFSHTASSVENAANTIKRKKRLPLGWEKLVQEANEGEGLKVKNWMKPVFAYFVPLCIIAIYIIGLATFKWK